MSPVRPQNVPATILLADDDEFFRKVVDVSLRLQGFQVITAHDGADALRMAREMHPDAVVLDGLMPEMGGHEVCERLKSDPQTADIPVVMVTGRSQAGLVERAFGAGADDYITKPFQLDELGAVLRALVGG